MSEDGALEIADAVRAGARRAVDMVAEALARIERADPVLCAFLDVWEEEALRRAGEVDARVAAGERLPLAGVPVAVKGRRGLRAAEPLLAAGAVAVGATSVPGPGTPWQTWGLGARGRTVNPWRADRTPGGSSAGAAVVVAAGLVPLATGADGAGSVRIPAAWCGVLGLKVTGGRFPSGDRTGLAAPGILARTAADAGLWWRVVSGCDARPEPPRFPLTAVWSPDLGYASPTRSLSLSRGTRSTGSSRRGWCALCGHRSRGSSLTPVRPGSPCVPRVRTPPTPTASEPPTTPVSTPSSVGSTCCSPLRRPPHHTATTAPVTLIPPRSPGRST